MSDDRMFWVVLLLVFCCGLGIGYLIGWSVTAWMVLR